MNAFICDPPNRRPIDGLWAFVSTDDKGNEGLCAVCRDGVWTPLIAAEPGSLEILRPLAQELAGSTTKTIRLIRLTTRQDIEVIRP